MQTLLATLTLLVRCFQVLALAITLGGTFLIYYRSRRARGLDPELYQRRLLALSEENAQLRTAVQALQSSLSWRLTRPLRAIRRIARS